MMQDCVALRVAVRTSLKAMRRLRDRTLRVLGERWSCARAAMPHHGCPPRFTRSQTIVSRVLVVARSSQTSCSRAGNSHHDEAGSRGRTGTLPNKKKAARPSQRHLHRRRQEKNGCPLSRDYRPCTHTSMQLPPFPFPLIPGYSHPHCLRMSGCGSPNHRGGKRDFRMHMRSFRGNSYQ